MKRLNHQRILFNLARPLADCYERLSFMFSKSGCLDVWGGAEVGVKR